MALIPAIELIVRFIHTEIESYLIFAGVFLLSTIYTITAVLADLGDKLIYWQVSYSSRNITYLLFFVHVTKMIWKNTPSIINNIGIMLYSISQFLIIFWEKFDGKGAGILTKEGVDLYSTDFRLIGNTFQLYVSILFLFAYMRLSLENRPKKLRNSIYIMRLMGVFLFSSRFIRFIQNFGVLAGDSMLDRSGLLILLFGFAVLAITVRRKGVIFLARVDLEGIIVISKYGSPITSIKFHHESTVSSTLISGVISAIQNVIEGIGSDNDEVQFISTGGLYITLRKYSGLLIVLVTNTDPTQVLVSSLNYFTKIYTERNAKKIEQFYKNGLAITNISDEIYLAFPYANYENIDQWF